MNSIFHFIEGHGYSVLFAAVFVRQIGIPIPGFPFLLAAGALAASGKLCLLVIIALAVCACVLADWLWYEAGRRGGERVLHFIHRFTRDPEVHDARAKRIFARYGLPLLLVAKFIPGVDAVAPPLAGISGASLTKFLAFDGMGGGLYACLFGGLGYAFSQDLNRAAVYVSQASRFSLAIAVMGICSYLVYRLVQGHGSVRG